MSGNRNLPTEPSNVTPWTRECFHTHAVVINGEDYYTITHVLLDSGASANFVSRELVQTIGLHAIRTTEGKTSSGFEGKTSTYQDKVCLVVNLFGVIGFLQAYVTESDDDNLIIGAPGLAEFRVQMDFAGSAGRSTLVTLAPGDLSGAHGSERYVVDPERQPGPASTIKLQSKEDVEVAHRFGNKYTDPNHTHRDVTIAHQKAEISRLQIQLEESELQRAAAALQRVAAEEREKRTSFLLELKGKMAHSYLERAHRLQGRVSKLEKAAAD